MFSPHTFFDTKMHANNNEKHCTKMEIRVKSEIIEEIGNFTTAAILSFFVGNKTKVQYWKQKEQLCKWFCMSDNTIRKILKELKENGYIEYKAVGRNGAKMTKIILTEKALTFIKDKPDKTTYKKENIKSLTPSCTTGANDGINEWITQLN